jgi:hypothetical protein
MHLTVTEHHKRRHCKKETFNSEASDWCDIIVIIIIIIGSTALREPWPSSEASTS